jgi:hypothetical protein
VAIRPEIRWAVLVVVAIAALAGISALALIRTDVAWVAGTPVCPHCRAAVEMHSSRCKTCREQYAWQPVPDEDSPISPWSLSALEDQVLQARVAALGREAAAARVAQAIGVTPAAAKDYLDKVSAGRCGWCGGTERDLAVAPPQTAPCPACFGRGACVACDGDRRMRRGDEGAGRDLHRYRAHMLDVSALAPESVQRKEARRLAEAFLGRWHGTEQATEVWFWPEWKAGADERANRRVVQATRERLDKVLGAVTSE